MPQDISMIPDDILVTHSLDAILEAQPLFVFRRFVEYKQDLTLRPAQKVSYPRLGRFGKGKKLSGEYDPIPITSRANSYVEIKIEEFGNSTESTQLLDLTSYRDELEDAALLFGIDYQEVLDDYLRDIYLATNNVQFAGGAVNTAAIAAGSFFNTAEVKDAVQGLKDLKAPPIRRGNDSFYVCVATPHQIRKIRDDAAWLDARKYVDPTDIYYGEAGRYENVVFIETTQMYANAETGIPVEVGASSQTIHNALIFGSRAVGYLEALPFELRQDPPKDLGRLIRLGWYHVCGSAILNDFIIRVKTS